MSPDSALLPRISACSSVTPGRRVGVEIELGGVLPARVAEIVAEVFEGQLLVVSDIEYEVPTTYGTFRIELDSKPLKEQARRDGADSSHRELRHVTHEMLRRLAGELIPSEVVTPPLTEQELPLLDDLVVRLGAEGGRGTFDALRFAFGVHFNAEVTVPSADSIYRHIRAFAILYPYLLRRGEVDLTRRITPYIDPYPHEYLVHVLQTSVAPSLDTLIDDYLRYNPTRYRALDLLPLFMHLDAPRVETAVNTSAVSPRPAYHYRLANSRVGEPGWTITHEWKSWLAVETLAADPERLELAAQAALASDDSNWLDWIKEHLVW